MEYKLKNKILMDISLYMYVEMNDVEYAYNKLNSFDRVLYAISLSRIYNFKIPYVSHVMAEIYKEEKEDIQFINKVIKELEIQ